MLIDTRRDDLRIIKTVKVLKTAMFSLLEHNNFNKITVRDICDEAQISRATFYSYFTDKYDFLKNWLLNIKPDIINTSETYEKTEKILNDYIYKNKFIVKNLIDGADNETLGILTDFTLSVLFIADEYKNTKINPKNVVLSNFFAGGILNYLLWQVRNKFPQNVTLINAHLYEIVKIFRELELKSE